MATHRFAIRRALDGGSDSGFEVFDWSTGEAVASGMRRAEAEAEARDRNHHASGAPAELAGLRAAIDAFVARAGHQSLILVARAAEALDDLRAELAGADRLIAEQQDRIAKLYELFPSRDGADDDHQGADRHPAHLKGDTDGAARWTDPGGR